ncbi:MAG: NBR1-Ig-like domain-containing protein [Anaerolineales bacterium]|jgi:hypothetical protein
MDAPSLDITRAYQTVESRLTQATLLTPTLTETPTPTLDQTEASQAGQNPGTQSPAQPSASELAAMCDKAAPGFPMIDVNIEDGTEMQPGQRFTKIWRLTNAGSCTWTREYQAIWFFGTKMGDSVATPLDKNVAPGESIEIEVELVAPQNPGLYRSDWKLMNRDGETFGIGPSGNATFWVQIQVVQPPTGTPAPIATPTETPEPTDSPDGTTVPTQEANVRVSARLVLALNDSLDLEDGEVNPESGADISYQPDDIGNNWITPINGTVIGVYGNNEPSQDICQLATMSSAPVAVGSISPGTTLCYRTETGLPGWLRLVAYNESDSSIEIDIITWEAPE